MDFPATARRSLSLALLAACLLPAAPPGAEAQEDTTAAEARTAPPVVPRTPAGWETLSTGLPEQARLLFRPSLRYNRVDGATPIVGAAVQSERFPAPFLYANLSFASARDRPLGAAGFEAPIGPAGRVRAGADAYRRTASEDLWIVGEIENTVFALLARTDYRDYYEAEGLAGRVIWEPGRDVGLEAGIRLESHASLRTEVRFSVTGKDDRFRPNPPITPGEEGLFMVSARIGPSRIPPRGGLRGTLGYERAGGFLERDFEYGRLRGAVHGMAPVTRRQTVRARLLAGSTREGSLPLQKIWHVGGIGTLRAHDYKAFSGDQYFVANAEYLVRVRKNLFPFTFLDFGAAWFGSGNIDRQRPALGAGIGLRVGEDLLSVTLGLDLRRDDAPLKGGIRLAGTF